MWHGPCLLVSFLAELLFADLGATMELGRSAPMLTSASPGRAAAMVPAPVERSEVRGHRQQIGKSAALTVGCHEVDRVGFVQDSGSDGASIRQQIIHAEGK